MNLYEKLQQANLPVNSATEDGAISMSAMTAEQQRIADAIIAEHFGRTIYEISPAQNLIRAGDSVELRVAGAPDSTETIYVNGLSQDVDLGDDGIVVIELQIDEAGDVYITDDHNNIAKVEVR
mgnify:CR=1 FL=1